MKLLKGKRMEPVLWLRLLHAFVCGVSQLVSQPLFMLEDSLRFTTLPRGVAPVLAGTQACTLCDKMVLFDPS